MLASPMEARKERVLELLEWRVILYIQKAFSISILLAVPIFYLAFRRLVIVVLEEFLLLFQM
jgi:hypothetical protein